VGPNDGDPNTPVVALPDIACGGPKGFGLGTANLQVTMRDVILTYPCDKHEGANVTFILLLHGTNSNEASKTSAAVMRPRVVFEPTVFAREIALENWPHLDKVISSGDQIAAAFEQIKHSPVWREDPRLRDIKPEVAEEVLDLYNAVIEDGQYIEGFLQQPLQVARKLGLKPSKQAIAVVVAAGTGEASDAVLAAAVVVSVAVVGAAITTAIVSSHADRRDRILIDESGP